MKKITYYMIILIVIYIAIQLFRIAFIQLESNNLGVSLLFTLLAVFVTQIPLLIKKYIKDEKH